MPMKLLPVNVPIAVKTADKDAIIPEARSAPVRKAAKDLRTDFRIGNASHNDIYEPFDFTTALIDSVNVLLDG